MNKNIENNNLIPAKEGIFSRIKSILLSLFGKNKPTTNTISKENFNTDNKELNHLDTEKKSEFKAGLAVEDMNETQRLLELKKKYDNEEISEEDISNEDMKALTKLYQEETAEIKKDIERRKQNIAKMLKQMKQKNVTEN